MEVQVARVLFVEDASLLREAWKRDANLGHPFGVTHFASGGNEAVQLLADNGCYDAVVLDVDMVTKSGIGTWKDVLNQCPHAIGVFHTGSFEGMRHTDSPTRGFDRRTATELAKDNQIPVIAKGHVEFDDIVRVVTILLTQGTAGIRNDPKRNESPLCYVVLPDDIEVEAS